MNRAASNFRGFYAARCPQPPEVRNDDRAALAGRHLAGEDWQPSTCDATAQRCMTVQTADIMVSDETRHYRRVQPAAGWSCAASSIESQVQIGDRLAVRQGGPLRLWSADAHLSYGPRGLVTLGAKC